jgi:ribosome biogenesis GTPase
MIKGKIIRGVGGFYYIQREDTPPGELVECKAKGIFRNRKVKPLVGDDVEIELLDEEHQTGSITRIFPRKNELIRPASANVDQAVVVFALSYPKPNLNLLDRFLLMMQTQEIPVVICFNKCDEQEETQISQIVSQYDGSGATVLVTSTVTGDGLDKLRELLTGKTTVMAGPSGVGKSSVMNILYPQAKMQTGEISDKIKRGKHTTRHTELFCIAKDTYIMDTPGFTSLQLPDIEKEELERYYPEFAGYEDTCRFLGCSHIHEPDCGVKAALERGEISAGRYENYKQFYQEISQKKKY